MPHFHDAQMFGQGQFFSVSYSAVGL